MYGGDNVQRTTVPAASIAAMGSPDGAINPVDSSEPAQSVPWTAPEMASVLMPANTSAAAVALSQAEPSQAAAATTAAGEMPAPVQMPPEILAAIPLAMPAPVAAPAAMVAPAAPVAPSASEQTPLATGAPVHVQLAPAPVAVAGGGVEIEPLALIVPPDPAGPVGQAAVTLTSQDAAAPQVVWVSAELPDLLAMEVYQTQPHVATLALRVDLARAAAYAVPAPTGARLYVTTAAGTTTVQVTWKPLPYGSM